ncbi:Microcystin degradation protein MlrC, contains DUF1485 domain [Massilia sp. PDC64]|nr:M81 family metallopeptidase [Massilia sp. PDC64]SDE80090.1 Microcystin degradation protein MlrC, contains DUF1485 domain [Massilia sp. PDC64]
MHIFAAQLLTETNTLTSTPTGWPAYEEFGLFHGDGSRRAPDANGAFLAALRNWCEADGHRMTESLCAAAQPNGVTVRPVYEALRAEILADLRAALPVDAVVLHLHGAMVADGCDDCEGEILDEVRRIVGPHVPVAVELDLHCHLTRRMLRAADILAAYQEYPHDDILRRARHVYDLAVAAAARRVHPVTAAVDCRMSGLWHTTREPMKSFVAEMQALEGRDGVLSVSLGHGFPWGDVAEEGARLWVVADGDRALAEATALRLARRFVALRDATLPPLTALDDALDAAARADGLTVLADVADNAGGGAPGDSTFILRRMLERGVRNAAIGAFWDLGAVHICRDAGVGARLDLRLGGKCGPYSGDPLDLSVTVTGVVEDLWQRGLDADERFGPAVALRTENGIDILVCSVRCQVFSPSAFTNAGIALADKQLVVVKSTQHFYTAFAPLAARTFYVSTPGALRQDFGAIPYRHRDPVYWPRITHPEPVLLNFASEGSE